MGNEFSTVRFWGNLPGICDQTSEGEKVIAVDAPRRTHTEVHEFKISSNCI